MKTSIARFVRGHSFAILCVIYLLSRLINLTKLPIFNDEAIYLDWGWKSLHTSAGLFYSLYDAKPPFLIWIFGVFESIIYSPLLMGRLVSVLAGLFALIGIYKIAKSLENERVALLSSVYYIVIPLFTFFDRQALMESAITATGVWGFYFLLQILETKKDKYLIYLGLTLGIGIFIKLQALVFLVSIILILIYKKRLRAAALSFITSLVILSPLLLQKAFWASFGSNNRFMLSISEILDFPFSLWIKNLSTTIGVSFYLLTPLIFISVIAGISLLFKRKKLLPAVYFITNIAIIIFLGRSLGTRYVTSFLALTPIFASLAILSFKKPVSLLIACITSVPAIMLTVLLIFSPLVYFNILDKMTALSQKTGYVSDWTSGYGIPETINHLENVSQGKQITVGVRIDAGNPESAMFTYFNNSKNIIITYIDPRIINPELLKLPCLPSNVPVYFVARDGILNGLDKFFQEDVRFGKPEGKHYISIHSLKKCN